MTALAADLLVVWLVVTAASSALLAVVVGVQDVLGRARRSAVRRRTRAARPVPRAGRAHLGRAAGPPAPR